MHLYVDTHLKECCIELMTWRDTGVLPDGRMRNATKFLTDSVFACQQLVHVENCVKNCAMGRIIAIL
jgi:hypothetical protein